jgi:hypothetical protein
MNKPLSFCSSLALAALIPSSVLAATATSLSSFGGIEEPVRIYNVSSDSFTTDSFVNITNVTSGTIQTLLRYSTSSWDGDRSTDNEDRGRAEVKTLGPNQQINQTFDYTTTWRTNSGFKGSGAFCHITQLKGTNGTEGSSGAPLVVTSINSGTSSAVVRYASTSFSPTNVFTTRTARAFSWAPNTWVALKIRIRTTADGATGGQVTASINNDALQGVTNVEVSRPQATNYYPKWGLYRKHETSSGFSANDYIQHSNVSANLVTSTPPANVTLEAESLAATTSGPTITTGSDSAASGGVIAYLNATATGQWAEFTTPSIAAGTYSLRFRYKQNNARGQHTVRVDGTQVGGTVDEYASTSGYTQVTLGNVTFASAGTHKIRLTVTGRNASSSSYVLAPDSFTFVGQ